MNGINFRRRMLMGAAHYNASFDFNNYLTIEALEDNLTVTFTKDIEYGIDGKNWITLKAKNETPPINIGQTLSFRGEFTPDKSTGIGTFTISKKCNLKGNCMSMLFGDNAANNYSLSGKNYAFYKLFYKCTNIVNVDSNFLPAITLATSCYESMFSGCSSLKTVPNLPATTLANYCYSGIFAGCTSLVNAPKLPATTLADYCYQSMFSNCPKLVNAPELPATTLATGCYRYMFNMCSFKTAPKLPATTLANSCYEHMFTSCSLRTAPELPATTLANYCYDHMFMNNSWLKTAPKLPATTLVTGCYEYMFYGCGRLTTAPKLPATTLATVCYRCMFYGCDILTTAPELPAATLANYCYESMFERCTKLNYIKMLATNVSASGCLSDWVYKVSSTGTFVKNAAMTSLPTGNSGIPSGWTVQNA